MKYFKLFLLRVPFAVEQISVYFCVVRVESLVRLLSLQARCPPAGTLYHLSILSGI